MPAAAGFAAEATWRTVDLPHDWAVELPFDRAGDRNHGFKPLGPGFEDNSIAWYRRTFESAGRGCRQADLADVRRRVPRCNGLGQRLARQTARGRLLLRFARTSRTW